MKKSYYSLLLIRVLKNTIQIFIDIFFVLYFMQLSNDNIMKLGTYNLFLYTALILIIFLIRNLLKKKNRIYLLRAGMIFNFLFFLLIILLNKNIIKYAPLLGIIYGFEEGLFFSIFNVYESTIEKKKLAKYSGTYTALNSILSIVIPIIFGSVMSFKGFEKCTMIVLVLVLIKLILTFIYSDENVTKANKINLKKYFKVIKRNKELLDGHMASFTNGLTYGGAFNLLITIYIIKVFKTGFSLGILTSIFSLITALASVIFANYISRKKYKNLIIICNGLTIATLILMVVKCNPITIIIFNFVQSFAKTYSTLININNAIILSQKKEVKDKYKEEYYMTHEMFTYVGRLISYIVFCMLAFANTEFKTNVIMLIFIIFMILRTIFQIRLQNCVIKEDKKT